MYANFAGRDASRGMAKQSFDEGECQVSLPDASITHVSLSDMLTPIDQPLDTLDNLTGEEMYVSP